jgi:broad-specificity NMP kinase
MDIIKFNNKSHTLTEKYAPEKISDIIGAKKQINMLVDWLDNYNINAKLNIKKQKTKKVGKKSRKRKEKEIVISSDDIALDPVNLADENDEIDGIDGTDDDNILDDLHTKKEKKKDPNVCSCAFVTGDHGTGKTAIVRAILNDKGYVIKSINFAKTGSIKSVDDFVEKILIGDDIYENMEKAKHKKFAVIVDEIQSASTPTEKTIITGLLKLNSEIWSCPIIFIGSNKHKKIMTNVKRECYHISIYAPDLNDMLGVFEIVADGENMKFESEPVVLEIIKHSQNDYRRLIVTIGELFRIYGSNKITMKDINNYTNVTGDKDMDKSIYENTTRLFSQYNGLNASLKIFETDKSTMPLMVQQNHFLATNGYLKDRSKIIDISSDITETIAHGDVVDNYIYSDQNWSLQETYGFYGCVNPSFILNQSINSSKLAHDSQYPYYRPVFTSLYPKDLNRTSTRCINFKNVKSANEYFQHMSIDDYVLASKFIKQMLDDGRIAECEKLLREYNLSAQSIMYILKIDKINGTRKDVPKSIEKRVKEISAEQIKPAIIRKANKK